MFDLFGLKKVSKENLIYFVVFILVLILSLSLYVYYFDFGSFVDVPVEHGIKYETLKYDIYFCPKDDCLNAFVKFLDSAKKAIDCAFYDLDLVDVIDVLNEKSKRNLGVKLIIDSDNSEFVDLVDKIYFDYLVDFGSGLMHHKFCVVDNEKLFVGSMNPTVRGTSKNNNNMVLFESKELSKNYLIYFDCLYDSIENGVGEGYKFSESCLRESEKKDLMIFSNAYVKNYFCPIENCEDKVISEISFARKSIVFAMFSFTADAVANEILYKNLFDVKVHGLFEKNHISKYSVYNLFMENDIDVREDKNKYNFHHKYFVIDDKITIFGSYNPSKNANTRNDENILIINSQNFSRYFTNEFDSLFD